MLQPPSIFGSFGKTSAMLGAGNLDRAIIICSLVVYLFIFFQIKYLNKKNLFLRTV